MWCVSKSLNILVVEPDASKAQEITYALQAHGWSNVTVIASNAQLAPILTQLDPDLILIDLANPDRDTLEHLSLTSQAKTRPVAMFVDHTDQTMTKAAIDAGVSAYVVGGLHKGLLMRARNISEDEAYNLLRKTAMGQGRKVADVAEALVTAADLLK